MSAIVIESLPYIDAQPTENERASAMVIITNELDDGRTPIESLIYPSSPLIEMEIHRVKRNGHLNAIDLSRYEAAETSLDQNAPKSSTQQCRDALGQAYTSHKYLDGRLHNLALLDKFGKNAWLIGNSQTEDILRRLEKDLENTKTAIDVMVTERKAMQEAAVSEILGLQEGWQKGIGRLLETEIAADGLQRTISQIRTHGSR